MLSIISRFFQTRTRHARLTDILILGMILCLTVFAVYRVVPRWADSSSRSQRLWVDPNQTSEIHTKVAPVSFIFLLLLTAIALLAEEFCPQFAYSEPFVKGFPEKIRPWLRPPPALRLAPR